MNISDRAIYDEYANDVDQLIAEESRQREETLRSEIVAIGTKYSDMVVQWMDNGIPLRTIRGRLTYTIKRLPRNIENAERTAQGYRDNGGYSKYSESSAAEWRAQLESLKQIRALLG